MLHSCFRGKGEISLRGVMQFPKQRSLKIGRTSEWHCKSERAIKVLLSALEAEGILINF